jgi:hypothetical protein
VRVCVFVDVCVCVCMGERVGVCRGERVGGMGVRKGWGGRR